jgi:hypothetical protein
MPHRMASLLSGMLLLTVLAFCLCVGIIVLAYRKRNQSGDE